MRSWAKMCIRDRIWLEDEESIKAKLEAVKSFDLAGLAGWKLGMESDSVWDLISNALQS